MTLIENLVCESHTGHVGLNIDIDYFYPLDKCRISQTIHSYLDFRNISGVFRKDILVLIGFSTSKPNIWLTLQIFLVELSYII